MIWYDTNNVFRIYYYYMIHAMDQRRSAGWYKRWIRKLWEERLIRKLWSREQSMGQEAMEVSIDVKAIDQGVIEGAMDGISDWSGCNV
jgi:hypothetical protein